MGIQKSLFSTVTTIAIASPRGSAARAAGAQARSRSTPTTSAAWSRGPNGPEAGVWVIAETTDLPTRYTKSVVTDDQGRYVIPDLPIANYQVWVRGYGLVDSPKMRAKPGQTLNHTAVPAPRRARGRALLSGDLLVHDDEDSAGEGFRRPRPTSRRTSRATPGSSA